MDTQCGVCKQRHRWGSEISREQIGITLLFWCHGNQEALWDIEKSEAV